MCKYADANGCMDCADGCKDDAPSVASAGNADAWLHILDNTDGIPENTPMKRLTFTAENPFGTPGEDYSAEYKVTSIPLYKRRRGRSRK